MRGFIQAALAALAVVASVASAQEESAKKGGKKHHHHHKPSGPAVYEMQVGSQDPSTGAMINAFFPNTLTIQTGDVVLFKVGSLEIHTVTFLGGRQVPGLLIPVPGGAPSQMMLNPALGVRTPGTSFSGGIGNYANSGIMGLVGQQYTEWNLTFPTAGVYSGLCAVHADTMNFTINVVAAAPKKSPKDVAIATKAQVAKAVATAHKAGKMLAMDSMWAPTPAPGGATQHYVLIGGMMTIKGGYSTDYNAYFPNSLKVKNGDLIKFVQSPMNTDVPHTVSFLAPGAQPPAFFIPVPQKDGSVFIEVNPVAAAPSSNINKPYTGTDFFSSGMLSPFHNFTMTVGFTGTLDYLCILHPYMQGKVTSA